MNAKQILDRATVISLAKRPERFDAFLKRYQEATGRDDVALAVGYDGRRLPIPNDWETSEGAFGACLAHVAAWARFLSDGDYSPDDPLTFFEDDAVFCDGFLEKLEKLAPLVPDDWDVFYLGGERLMGRPAPAVVAEVDGLAVMREINVNRLHAYVVRARAMKTIFPRLLGYLTSAPARRGPSGDETCFDYEFGRLTENGALIVYGARPFLVGQGPFGSDTYPGKGAGANVLRYWN